MRAAPLASLVRVVRGVVLAASLCSSACERAADEAPPAPTNAPREGLLTAGGLYRVSWTPVPDPIPLSQLFEVQVVVTDAVTGAPEPSATVRVDATMPEHGHGMPTRAEVDPGACPPAGVEGGCVHERGIYTVRGMKLHMPGHWVLAVDVDGSRGPDRLETPVGL